MHRVVAASLSTARSWKAPRPAPITSSAASGTGATDSYLDLLLLTHTMQTLHSGSAQTCKGLTQRRACLRRPVVAFAMPRVAGSSPRSIKTSNHVARAGKLEEIPLFADSSSFLSGPDAVETKSAAPKVTVDDVPLESEVGMDYTALRDHLKAGEFQKADDETRALLIRLAGENAIKRNWVYFTEVKSISIKDFQTMDTLWRTASSGKFGFSVQKELWIQNSKRWGKFFKQIDWTHGENNNYRKWPMEFKYTMDAPKGHLPLTNALRGTQLFQAILEHPAFEKAANKKTLDDAAKEAAKNTMKLW